MKKKVALFYDENTESGRIVLSFLKPFEKRKSDIVGRLILNWIAEHGATVPVEWLTRGEGDIYHYVVPAEHPKEERRAGEKPVDAGKAQAQGADASHDVNLIRAGLASFMG